MECILEIILINIEENIIYLNLKKKIYDKQSNFLKEELELITKLRITKKLVSYLDYIQI
jgi:hypothetical protein